MTIIARKIVLSPDARIECDLFTDELKIMENGVERDATPREIVRLMNGHRITVLGTITEIK